MASALDMPCTRACRAWAKVRMNPFMALIVVTTWARVADPAAKLTVAVKPASPFRLSVSVAGEVTG